MAVIKFKIVPDSFAEINYNEKSPTAMVTYTSQKSCNHWQKD